MVRTLRHLLLALPTLAACAGEGRLLISLELSSTPSLNPMLDPRLSRFALRVTHGGRTTTQTAALASGPEVPVGNVPVGEPFELRLAAEAATGQMIGLGLQRDVLVTSSGESSYKLAFRKPVAYVAGGDQLRAVDTAALARGATELSTLPLPGVGRIAGTANGKLLAAVAGRTLHLIPTGTHSPGPAAATLPLPGLAAAVSPDSRFVAVAHQNGTAGSLSLVDLSQSPVEVVPVGVGEGLPRRLAFAPDGRSLHVLLDGTDPRKGCASPASSRLVRVQLAERPYGAIPPALSFDEALADVAVDPRDGALLVASPCKGAISRVTGDRALEPVLPVPSPYDLAITDSSLVAMGRAPDEADRVLRGQAVVVDLSHPGFPGANELRALRKTFVPPGITIGLSTPTSPDGLLNWVSVPKSLTVGDLELSPDGKRALALFEGAYASNLDFGSCAYRSAIQATGYLLLDLTDGAVVLGRFTRLAFSDCYANCIVAKDGQPLTTKAVCEEVFRSVLQNGEMLPRAEFDPAGAALLFGGS